MATESPVADERARESVVLRFQERVCAIESRLERLLASGWRNAGGEAEELQGEASALAELGVAQLAERVRAVSEAQSPAEGLAAVALALSACRLVRTRLAGEERHSDEEGWQPIGAGRRRGRPDQEAPDRLLPVARMAVGAEEAWVCLRLQGGYAEERLLVEPAQLVAPAGASGAAGWNAVTEPEWLGALVRGRLRWRARYPLGASGTIERCALLNGTLTGGPAEGSPTNQDTWELRLVDQVRQSIRKGWRDGAYVLGGYGHVRLARLHVGEAESYVWPDEAASALFRAACEALKSDEVWAIAWKDDAMTQPLALLSPGGLLKKPELIHLVPGLPRTRLE